MLDAAIVCSFLLGIAVTLILQFLILRRHFRLQQPEPIKTKSQFPRFVMPKELLKLATDPEQFGKKESCVFLNLICQFLFKELKDTKFLRQWAIKKMNVEFGEMLQNTTTGKLIDQISVREFSLGNTFPVIKSAAVHNVKLEKDAIEELDVAVELDYSGGFHLSVDIDLVFGKWTYLSVVVTNLRGSARLRFTRQPYTHWSFLFFEEPQMDFTVESKFGSRPIPQITSLIINQIKRVVRKRHTLPNYKFRYKPFFDKYVPFKPTEDVYLHGNKLGQGQLEVTVMECSRLKQMPSDSTIYCTLSVDTLPWLELIDIRKKVWVVFDIEIIRGQSTSIGMTFKEDFILEKYEDAVVVDEVTPDTPAGQADIRKGDIIVSVETSRVTSTKQAKKLFKNAGERFIVRVERPKSKVGMKEQQFNEETISIKDLEVQDKEDKLEQGDDFVNISFKTVDTEVKQMKEMKDTQPANERSPQKRLMSVVNSGKALLQRKSSRGQSEAQPSVSKTLSSPIPIPKTSSFKELDDKSQSATSSPQHRPDRSRQRAHSDTSLIRLAEADSGSHSEIESVSDNEDDVCDMKRTKEVTACQNPAWNQKFTFDVDEEHKYLNVCVWCKSPEKLDKHDRVVKPGKEILIGHKTVSVTDIALDCLMTLQCDTQQTITLVPPELRAGASRSKISNYANTQGKEECLCYGDVTLAFSHNPIKLSDKDRKVLTNKDLSSMAKKTDPEKSKSLEKDMEVKADNLQLEQSISDGQVKRLEIGRHDFTIAHFSSATYCHFCGRKIWLKAAVQCDTCNLICHKKCTEACQSKTLCTRQGAKVRTMPSEPWKPPVNQSDDRKRTTKSRAGAILSKFRKDSAVDRKQAEQPSSAHSTPEHIPILKISPIPSPQRSPQLSPLPSPRSSPQPSPQLSPQTSPFPPRRRNSAPGTAERNMEQEVGVSTGPYLSVHALPHAFSAAALQDLLNKPSLSSISVKDFIKDEYESESSDESDSGVRNLIRRAKRRVAGQNLDEMVVTAAKEMGKELYAELSLEERKEKLDSMVTKLQKEIDRESENKTEIMKAEQETTDPIQKETMQTLIAKSDEKVEAMMMMMLHYCAGLQYCLDQEEEERKKLMASSSSEKLDIVITSEENDTLTLENIDRDFEESTISEQSENVSEETFVESREVPDDDSLELRGVPNGNIQEIPEDESLGALDGFKEGISFTFDSSDSEAGLSDGANSEKPPE